MVQTQSQDPITNMSTMTASRTSSNLAPIQHASAKMIAQAEASKKPMETIVEDGKVDMRLLMIALWKNRKNQQFTEELCEQLSHLVITKPALDQVEFYLPQLAHMVVHLEKELPIDAMEQFVMLLSQSSVHFALQFFWIIYASLDENRPKRNGNPRTFARCAQLLLALEQCLIYGSPVAREVSELLTKHSISKAEMEQILMADRRFFAAQSSMSEISYDDVPEGWLLKKGGGTSRMGRRSWKLRWCRIERRIMLIYSRQTDIHPRAAVPLDRAEIHVVENPKHPFYFEIAHRFSETKFKFAAQNHEEMVQWIRNIQKAAAVPDPPATSPTRRAGPARTLVRMTDAMRSFILQDSNQCSTGPGSPLPVAPSLSSPTSIKNRSGALSQSSSTGGISAEALVERLHAVISPGKISSMSVSVATSEQTEMTLTDNSWDEDMLPSDQQRRYEFFSDFINFIKSITDVSEEMRHIEPSQRKALLCPKLEKLIIPSKGYIPLCKSTDKYCNVISVCCKEGRVFSTNERAPCLIYFEAEENDGGEDVSRALFNYLYETDIEDSTPPPEPESASFQLQTHTKQLAPFLRELLSNEIRKKKLETIFGSLSFTMDERIRQESIISDPQRWRIVPLIAKSHDDLRQEVLVMQLITFFQKIFEIENLPLRLHPYRILSTGASTGLIEVVRNAMSLDGIKKTPGFKNLRTHFEEMYGPMEGDEQGTGKELLQHAQMNFIHSLAAYSIVCYILSIKDRHNGNILIDIEGHIVHIDFGFFLGRAPGGSFSFETAPFKLTTEMVDVIGGRNSQNFKYFSDLCVKGALAARKHSETIYTLVEVMSFHSKLPCFLGNTSYALSSLRDRLFLNMSEEKIAPTIMNMIERSYDHFGTNKYDQYQVYSNGIAK